MSSSESSTSGDSTDDEYVDNYADVSMFHLDDDREMTLLNTQTECTFMWTTRDGDPVGVIMNYVFARDRFWMTCTRRRKRVPAIEARPRVAVAISSRGTDIGVSQSITYKGTATVHEDEEIATWFYAALAARVRPGDPDKQAAFIHHLEAPDRIVIEIEPDTRIGFDSEAMFANSPAGKSNTRV